MTARYPKSYLTLSAVVKLDRVAAGSPTDFARTFWERVDQSGGDDACWPWTGGKYDTGYGAVWAGGRSQKAHRMAWVLTFGPLAPRENVLHRCDNRPCCNPGHLFVGTHKDNTADMVAKGRHGRDGRRHLQIKQIVPIREKYAAGATLKQLGAEYGVTWVAIWKVIHRHTWKDVA